MKVIWQKIALATSVFSVILGLNGCSGASQKYRDTSELELPPQLEINVAKVEQAADSESNPDSNYESNSERKRANVLNNLVSMPDESHLIINRPFDSAWLVLEQILRIADIEISDRNREKGQYFVLFDPDNAEKPNKASENLFSSLFKENDYPKGRYALTFYENPKSVKIHVEFLESVESNEGSAGQTTDDGVAKLVRKLYFSVHDNPSANK